jgi:hypothetical protein
VGIRGDEGRRWGVPSARWSEGLEDMNRGRRRRERGGKEKRSNEEEK